ncbi:MAG TPA: hypothetical protein VFB06_01105 [Streptosporangiaceae bacterium]|nr:hypothetical protein [Streptosporangiaceae bacterium]
MVSAGRAVAEFDSASAMMRVLGAALNGHEAPVLALFPPRAGRLLEPSVDWLVGRIERLPESALAAIYRQSGRMDAVTARRVGEVRADQLASWVVQHYPRRRYPVVFIGSSNGALTHLAAALGAPWLPQTLLLAVKTGGLDPDEPAADMRAMSPAGQRFLAANPGMALHHMHDPVQDRLMIAGMAYFRVKFRQLPAPYRAFLAECLEPGGTVVVVDCTRTWPVTTVGDRHVFQFGALGGATEREFQHGSSRVVEFLRRQGARRDRWQPPVADQQSPEAEWGFAEPLATDIDALAGELGLTVERLRFGEPEDTSPLIAELFRHWYADQGLPSSRLLVSSFLLMDPMLTIRTRSVPYWALFGTQPSLDRLTGYLSGTSAYDDIRLTVFPHGAHSIGLPTAEQWRAATGYASRHGELVAVDPDRYPRHFRALTGFHHELRGLPRAPAAPPLTWDAARRYLASHATSHNATFGAESDRDPAR